MKIYHLRNKIDKIDKSLLNLFEKRMKVSLKIAKNKISNNKNIFDITRENEILKTIQKHSNRKFKHSNNFLFSTVINAGKFFQYKKIKTLPENIREITNTPDKNINEISTPRIGCLKTNDSYSKIAASRAFPSSIINNYSFLSDLFDDIDKNKIDFGFVETKNIYDIVDKNNIYIYKVLNINASYCLAVNPKNKDFFKQILSTNQILSECSNYLKKHQYEKSTLNLTFDAAFLVSKLDEPLAAICPKEIALEHKLNIIEENIQDNIENNKQFLVISKKLYNTKNQNILSFSIKTNDINKFLISILTYFNINRIKPLQLHMTPSNHKNEKTTIYLNFMGNINDESSISFMNFLSLESDSFQLLGYYNEEKI